MRDVSAPLRLQNVQGFDDAGTTGFDINGYTTLLNLINNNAELDITSTSGYTDTEGNFISDGLALQNVGDTTNLDISYTGLNPSTSWKGSVLYFLQSSNVNVEGIGIDSESSSQIIVSSSSSNMNFDNLNLAGLYGINFYDSDYSNITITNSTFNSSDFGIYQYRGSFSDLSLIDNTFDSSSTGIYVSNGDGLFASGNSLFDGGKGFYLLNVDNGTIENNFVCNNSVYDIYLDSNSNENIGDNTCDNLVDDDSNSVTCSESCVAICDPSEGSEAITLEDSDSDGKLDVTTCCELQHMRDDLTADYELMNNINCSNSSNWNFGDGFEPVGNSTNSFRGSLEGNGYVIDGLYIDRFNESDGTGNYIGLLGYIENVNISNVGLINLSIKADTYAGGLAGEAYNSNIFNSYAIGKIEGRNYYFGGLIGVLKEGGISNSHSSVDINGRSHVGGLVGEAYDSEILNSHSMGSLSASSIIGGLIGFVDSSDISESYSTGKVFSFNSNAGGLIGEIEYSSISDSYATGDVIASFGTGGGLIGTSDYTLIENSYATGDVTGENYVAGFISYPYSSEILNSYATGNVNGTKNIGGFISYSYNATILNSSAIGNVSGEGPVGGFIAQADSLTLISDSLAEGYVTGSNDAGGFVGNSYGSNFLNSYAIGNVDGSYHVGGFAAFISNSEIFNSYSIGNVFGDWESAGFSGLVQSSTISNSHATGDVRGGDYVGGFIGRSYDSVVDKSYSEGDIQGNSYVGCFIGKNSEGTVLNSDCDGVATQTLGYSAGFISVNTGTIENCSSVCGVENGFVGENSGECSVSEWYHPEYGLCSVNQDTCQCINCFDEDNDGYYGGSSDYVCYGSSDYDCDDTNPEVNPGALEVCDGIDNDCSLYYSGSEDYSPDGSEDYYGPEGSADYLDPTTCGVGECSGNTGVWDCIDGSKVNTCNPYEGAVAESCDDETGYDGLDNNCDGTVDLDCNSYCDADGDGYTGRAFFLCLSYPHGDCDDTNANINPGQPEIACDGIDNDCQITGGSSDYSGEDDDNDGYVVLNSDYYDVDLGYCGAIDCNDLDASIYPGTTQTQSCAGDSSFCSGEQTRTCQDTGSFTNWGSCDYSISNGNTCDDYNACTSTDTCSEGFCSGSAITCPTAGSCDDSTGYVWTGVCDPNSGCTRDEAPQETCDGLDNDCDGQIDNDISDIITDIFGYDSVGQCQEQIESCINGIFQVTQEAMGPNEELCDVNNIDEDCDGSSNEGCQCVEGETQQCGETDAGECAYGTQTCDIYGQWGECAGVIYPTEEVCDGLDNDCDGEIDEDIADIVTDVYGYDSIGECQVQVESCIDGSFQIVQEAIGPVNETCDGLDNNCNGLVDDADQDLDGLNDCNGEDKCPGTLTPEGVPTNVLNPNHYAGIFGNLFFQTNIGTKPDPNIVDSEYAITDAYGCSCEQILYCKPGANSGEYKFGCSEGTMNVWTSQIGWAPDCQENGNGKVIREGESREYLEDTDGDSWTDPLDADRDNDGIPNSDDSEIESAAPEPGKQGKGKPDWWCSKHPKKC